MKEYDYLVVGAGLFAAVFVRQAIEAGKRCLVIDKRSHIGGNIYCENVDGIHVHQYGAHIFHTDNKQVWDYVNRFVSFNRYTNSPLANYKVQQRNFLLLSSRGFLFVLLMIIITSMMSIREFPKEDIMN